MSIEIPFLLTFICAVCTVGAFMRTGKKDTDATARETATIIAKLDSIQVGIDEIKQDVKNVKADVKSLEKRVTVLETIIDMKGEQR